MVKIKICFKTIELKLMLTKLFFEEFLVCFLYSSFLTTIFKNMWLQKLNKTFFLEVMK